MITATKMMRFALPYRCVNPERLMDMPREIDDRRILLQDIVPPLVAPDAAVINRLKRRHMVTHEHGLVRMLRNGLRNHLLVLREIRPLRHHHERIALQFKGIVEPVRRLEKTRRLRASLLPLRGIAVHVALVAIVVVPGEHVHLARMIRPLRPDLIHRLAVAFVSFGIVVVRNVAEIGDHIDPFRPEQPPSHSHTIATGLVVLDVRVCDQPNLQDRLLADIPSHGRHRGHGGK